jgi:hypothetical protein
MAQSRLQQLNISFTPRRAIRRGPTSSNDWNDNFDEISNDFTDLYYEWNSFLHPLLLTVPDGTDDSSVNAFSNGLDGANLYANSDASATSNANYYDSINARPYTVFEQFEEVYTYMENVNATLSNDISGVVRSAATVSIVDTAGLYDAENVETALAEVATDVQDFLTGTSYLPLSGGILTGQVSNTIPETMEPTGAAQTINWNNGNIQVIDLNSATGNVTLTFENAAAGATLIFEVIQGAVARNIVWPAAVIWPGGAAPIISAANDDIDFFSIFYDGTNYITTYEQAFS